MRCIAYGSPADSLDEYCALGESTTMRALKELCSSTVACFASEWLRGPNESELRDIESQSRRVGFAGCIGALDCAGWDWSACPRALQGAMNGKERRPVVRMEVICVMNPRIWHLCFGFPRSMSDLNILSVSPHCAEILTGRFPSMQPSYTIGGESFDWFYYLVDGIYPPWRIFLSTIAIPTSTKEMKYKALHESVRKCIERVFGVLFKRFGMISRPSRLWFSNDMTTIMQACVIIRNMLTEYRESSYTMDGIGRIRDSVLSGIENQRESPLSYVSVESDGQELPVYNCDNISLRIKSFPDHVRLLNAIVDHIAEKF